jgi:hypothetical protein
MVTLVSGPSAARRPGDPARWLPEIDRGATRLSAGAVPRTFGLDTIEDDEDRRLVVNSKAVAWNGLGDPNTFPGLR